MLNSPPCPPLDFPPFDLLGGDGEVYITTQGPAAPWEGRGEVKIWVGGGWIGPGGWPPEGGDEVGEENMGWGGIDDDGQVPSYAESAPTLPHKICMPTGFLCFFPIQKIALLGYKFGPEHKFTKVDPK